MASNEVVAVEMSQSNEVEVIEVSIESPKAATEEMIQNNEPAIGGDVAAVAAGAGSKKRKRKQKNFSTEIKPAKATMEGKVSPSDALSIAQGKRNELHFVLMAIHLPEMERNEFIEKMKQKSKLPFIGG
ncbi:Two-component response regulator ARR1 [Quillaja saponaria]|uniref:Two-component response regulator ARR1 n=1 Tax=Quillaja saponaria TaxID=32244 RepID=A0AAD7LRW1_QUISA|nr:Two-component response regulator ARR1 [Quillaja saponaria]